MVYLFTGIDPEAEEDFIMYMGKDKFENDPLIQKSHPTNLWFHVDKHSSAHVYVQLPEEKQKVPFENLQLLSLVLEQAAQLTKANSIKASKLNNITVIYTPVGNLKSDGLSDTGTVQFVNAQKVKRVHVARKDTLVINRLNRTKTEVPIDQLIQDQEQQRTEWQRMKKEQQRKQEQLLREQLKSREAQKAFRRDPYASLYTEEALCRSTNEHRKENWVEDEFW